MDTLVRALVDYSRDKMHWLSSGFKLNTAIWEFADKWGALCFTFINAKDSEKTYDGERRGQAKMDSSAIVV